MAVVAPESQTYSNTSNNFSSYSLSACGVSGGCFGSSGTGQGGGSGAANVEAEAKQVLLRNRFELLEQLLYI